MVRGRRRDMGLGSVNLVSLEEARDLARSYRRIAREGGDPVQERSNSKGSFVTLKEAALEVHKLNAPTWKNKKHSDQWISSLERHVFPLISDTPISEVTSSDILRVLSPIWVEKSDILPRKYAKGCVWSLNGLKRRDITRVRTLLNWLSKHSPV